MQASQLALVLLIISREYPDAEVVAPENRDFKGITVERPRQDSIDLSPANEIIIRGLGFRYSDAHGANWHAEL